MYKAEALECVFLEKTDVKPVWNQVVYCPSFGSWVFAWGKLESGAFSPVSMLVRHWEPQNPTIKI